jgi:hypothetical protein
MAIFGSDWLDDYDSMREYETNVGFSNTVKSHNYDKPIFSPIHIDDDYDSIYEYEHNIKHFQE